MNIRWLEGPQKGEPIPLWELARDGVHADHLPLDPSQFEPVIAALSRGCGYVARDEVRLDPETPNLDAILAKFTPEHSHAEDEVRFVLSGDGTFDIRSRDDRWMRVDVAAGDLLIIPRDRHHRFTLGDSRHIRCVRLFQDPVGWVAHYREAA